MPYARATGLLVLAVAACGRGGPKVALRYHPPAGAVYHYALEQRTQISMQSGPLANMGKQAMVMRLHFTQTVNGPATGGGTEVVVVLDDATLEMPGIAANAISRELARLRGTRNTVVFDDRGQIVSTKVQQAPQLPRGMTNPLSAGIKAITFGFPERPVGGGDSWTVTTDLPLGQLPGTDASTAGPATTLLTVREIRIAGADTSVVIDVKMQFPKGPIRLNIAGQPATMQMEGDLSGYQTFSLSRGAMVDGTIKGSAKLSMTSAMLGSKPMSMLTDTESSIFLLPEP